MKKAILSLALVGLVLMGGQAFAVMCAIDEVPAATLLLPYFEVELGNDQGMTTLFEINNASAAAALAHVTLWTNWSIPTIDFDVYLTGYDVVPINLRDVFNGILPQTGPTVSNLGDYSWGHVNFPNCGILPIGNLPGTLVAHIQAAHTGQQSPFDGACYGGATAMAVGYITIDNVNACSQVFPNATGYFVQGGTGIANNDNMLWGNYYMVDPGNNFAMADTLVHIEAETDFFAGAAVPVRTFYGRYVNYQGADEREPLGTTWAARYVTGGAFSGGTDFLVWRDSGSAAAVGLACGTVPAWYPMDHDQVVFFDEEENPSEVECTVSPCPPDEILFPIETGRYDVSLLGTPWFAGWAYLNLNDGQSAFCPAGFCQSYVAIEMSAEGRYTVGFQAVLLNHLCNPATVRLPVLPPN